MKVCIQAVAVLCIFLAAGCELPVSDTPPELDEIEFWGYQIQGVDSPGAVDRLAASDYDMLVLEPTRTDWSSDTKEFDTAGMVARLKQTAANDGSHRKLIIAYIDIGEAEDWRWYWTWSQDWTPGAPFPDDWPEYILALDPDGWEGNYPVAYWDDDWKDIVIYGDNQSVTEERDYVSIIDEVIRDGFDGIYLDWVEAFENETVIQAAREADLDPAEEMIAFIGEMRDYAAERNPDFLIIQQNAAALAEGHPELFGVIDAIAQEAVWYDGNATDDWLDSDGYDWINEQDLVEYYTGHLQRYLAAGVPVFSCEYALNYADDAYEKSYDAGYVPYVTRRSLSRLSTTPPPGY